MYSENKKNYQLEQENAHLKQELLQQKDRTFYTEVHYQLVRREIERANLTESQNQDLKREIAQLKMTIQNLRGERSELRGVNAAQEASLEVSNMNMSMFQDHAKVSNEQLLEMPTICEESDSSVNEIKIS